MHTSVAVVIPVYQNTLSSDEKLSLQYLMRYLSGYQMIAVIPNQLHLPKELSEINGLKTEVFAPSYFKNIHSYSQLLLMRDFYERFLGYEYILIYQLDALVLSNKLNYWVKQGYDYIGAPWQNSLISFLTHPKGNANAVGNGGFSLRKVKSHLKTLQMQKSLAKSQLSPYLQLFKAIIGLSSRNIWLRSNADKYPFNEDGFWSLEAPKINPEFRVAPTKLAYKFAWEKNSEVLYKKYNKLPFGVHAWRRYNDRFWSEMFD